MTLVFLYTWKKTNTIMEILVENWAEREMTAYESEIRKPMPSKTTDIFNLAYL
jgi:hypothetical protein